MNVVTSSKSRRRGDFGAISVESFGEIDTSPGFHNEEMIFPVGYRARRKYWNLEKRSEKTDYILEVRKEPRKNVPLFCITHAKSGRIIRKKDPERAWVALVKLVNRSDHAHARVRNLSGREFFGFYDREIQQRIEALPRVDECSQYQKQIPVPSLDNASDSTPSEPTTGTGMRKRRSSSAASSNSSFSLSSNKPTLTARKKGDWLANANKIMKTLRTSSKPQLIQPFLQPVDPERDKCPDYHERIAQPMDLGTIQERLDAGDKRVGAVRGSARRSSASLASLASLASVAPYSRWEEFLDDLFLVWSNAMTYNGENHWIHTQARKFRDEAHLQVSKVDPRWASENPLRRSSRLAEHPKAAETRNLLERPPRVEETHLSCPVCRGRLALLRGFHFECQAVVPILDVPHTASSARRGGGPFLSGASVGGRPRVPGVPDGGGMKCALCPRRVDNSATPYYHCRQGCRPRHGQVGGGAADRAGSGGDVNPHAYFMCLRCADRTCEWKQSRVIDVVCTAEPGPNPETGEFDHPRTLSLLLPVTPRFQLRCRCGESVKASPGRHHTQDCLPLTGAWAAPSEDGREGGVRILFIAQDAENIQVAIPDSKRQGCTLGKHLVATGKLRNYKVGTLVNAKNVPSDSWLANIKAMNFKTEDYKMVSLSYRDHGGKKHRLEFMKISPQCKNCKALMTFMDQHMIPKKQFDTVTCDNGPCADNIRIERRGFYLHCHRCFYDYCADCCIEAAVTHFARLPSDDKASAEESKSASVPPAVSLPRAIALPENLPSVKEFFPPPPPIAATSSVLDHTSRKRPLAELPTHVEDTSASKRNRPNNATHVSPLSPVTVDDLVAQLQDTRQKARRYKDMYLQEKRKRERVEDILRVASTQYQEYLQCDAENTRPLANAAAVPVSVPVPNGALSSPRHLLSEFKSLASAATEPTD